MLTELKKILVLLAFLGAGRPSQRGLTQIVTIVGDDRFGEDLSIESIGQILLELIGDELVNGVDGSFYLTEKGIGYLKSSYLINFFRERAKDLSKL